MLYQLGTILSIILCDGESLIPKNFIKINKKIKVNLLNATIEERAKIFSDIFAVTLLRNTELECFAPFVLNQEANNVLEDYFKDKIKNASVS